MTKRANILLGSILIVFLAVGSAMAVPVYSEDGGVSMYLKQNTFPDNLSEDQVFLDMDTAKTITGHVGSQTGTPLVTFSSATDTLDAANGFATIKAVDDYLNSITITAPGYWFEDLIFSVNLTPNSVTDLLVTATDKSGDTYTFSDWTSESHWVPGDNRILVLADTGNLMQSVTIESQNDIGLVGGIDQLKQTEISGLAPVPEPATMLLLGSGLIGLAGLRKKFRKH